MSKQQIFHETFCRLEQRRIFQPGKIIYLKDGEQSIDYGVEIRGGSALGEVELSTEELHSEQGEDEDEQKEE